MRRGVGEDPLTAVQRTPGHYARRREHGRHDPQHADPDRRFPCRRRLVSEHRRGRYESVVGGKRPGRSLIDPTRATTHISDRAGVRPGCACRLHLQSPLSTSRTTDARVHAL